jgi:hypothetical protein
MTIRISRNAAANCINFVGSSLPAYYNACLSGSVDSDTGTVNVVNDIQTANDPNGAVRYEFYQIPHTEFADKDGNPFADAQAAADYITQEGNVLGVSDVGTSLNGVVVNFRLDQTSTSVIMDNGSAFGVNTIKAVPDSDGTIHIHAIGAGVPEDSSEPDEHKHFEGLQTGNAQVNGVTVPGGINDVCNALNELFTVGPFESVVISDPFSTMIADVAGVPAGYTLEGSTSIDPAGSDIFTNSGSGNYAGMKSTATIDQAGEYFTFDIRVEGQIGFGLVHTDDSYADGYYAGNANYADPASFAVVNSAHNGYQFSHWFHPTPDGSWTNYGASTGFIYGSGWYNWDQKQDWLDGNPVKVKVGIDENGFIAISSLQDDGSWRMHARSSYPVPEGAVFHLGIKSANAAARVYSAPMVHLLEPAAPTMHFRYIESPDGNFEYPLFATEEEANYFDLNSSGTGTSHTHTYADDPTATTWYMPDNGGTMTATSAPSGQSFLSNPVNYTEITSLTNADLSPPAFSNADLTYEEGTAVNVPLMPADASYSQSVAISPSNSGLVYNSANGFLQGTLTDVGADTTYTITVTRANAYGSSVGNFTITATDVAPANTLLTPWTKALDFSGSSEHASQSSNNVTYTPLRMGNLGVTTSSSTTAGTTSSSSNARPWATAIVFKSDGNSANQHLWNSGDGVGSNQDNIYVRQSASGDVYFGWGRDGALNECFIGDGFNTNTQQWHGLYIAHNGERFSGNDATAANLADAFDIRFMRHNYTTNQWELITGGYGDVVGNRSTSNNWNAGSTGGRMDRAFGGFLTVGGRGSNRNWHGKVASMVVTTLLRGVAMPTDAEIEIIVTDPNQWLTDYKRGQTYRLPDSTVELTNFGFSGNGIYALRGTQVWIMGDGSGDSYSNMIRNRVEPNDQNYTKLNMVSMVSNDIQDVTIPGLS